LKIEHTQCSETLAFKPQTPVNHPEESTHLLEQGENFEIKNKATFTHPIALAM
jgi:hypothetical protein